MLFIPRTDIHKALMVGTLRKILVRRSAGHPGSSWPGFLQTFVEIHATVVVLGREAAEHPGSGLCFSLRSVTEFDLIPLYTLAISVSGTFSCETSLRSKSDTGFPNLDTWPNLLFALRVHMDLLQQAI
jgi:hypothetical protein